MNLNLQIVIGELEDHKFEGWFSNAFDEFPCAYPKIYEGGKFESRPLYVANAEQLPENPIAPDGASIVCLGNPPEAYFQYPFNIISTKEQLSLVSVENELLDIFDRYETWRQSIDEAIEKHLPLKEIARTAVPIVGNPILLQTLDLFMLFHLTDCLEGASPELLKKYSEFSGVPKVPIPDNYHIDYDYMVELVSDPMFEEADRTVKPKMFDSPRFEFRCLYYNIVVDGRYVARVLFDEVTRKFSSKDYSLIVILGQYLGKALKDMDTEKLGWPKDFDIVVGELLSHKLVKESRIIQVLKLMGWEIHDEYCCVVLTAIAYDTSEGLLRERAQVVSKAFPACTYQVVDEKIVLLINISKSKMSRSEMISTSATEFRDSLLIAGYSSSYDNFMNLYYYYLQACKTLEVGRKQDPTRWAFKFEDYQLLAELSECKGRLIPEALYPEGLKRLVDYDRKHKSCLVDVLRIFIENDRNIAATARIGYMNRNTCLYRLKRIGEISKMDLDDPNVRLVLELAFKISEHEEKENAEDTSTIKTDGILQTNTPLSR